MHMSSCPALEQPGNIRRRRRLQVRILRGSFVTALPYQRRLLRFRVIALAFAPCLRRWQQHLDSALGLARCNLMQSVACSMQAGCTIFGTIVDTSRYECADSLSEKETRA